MIKRTLYFGNPSYLSLRNAQLVLRLPEVSNNDTLPDTFKGGGADDSYRRYRSGRTRSFADNNHTRIARSPSRK